MPRKTRRGWPGREPGYSLDIGGRISPAYFRVSDNPDTDEQKSVGEQQSEYDAWVPRAGVTRGARYADDDRSASEFADREREDFARLRGAIDAGQHDEQVLWFWSTSRQTRGDIPLDLLARASAAHGVVWSVNGRVLNPANDEDLSYAEMNNMVDKMQPRAMRKDVLRAKKAAATAGRPAGVPIYGYTRVYQTDAAGQPVLVKGRPVIIGDEPAEPAAQVVREIFDRVEALETLSGIAVSLETRRVPTPRRPRKCTTCGEKMRKTDGWYCTRGHDQDLFQWHPSAVRFIAMNEGYLGHRIFQAASGSPQDRRRAVLPGVQAKWPPMVTEEQFWRVQNILADHGRARWRGESGGGNTIPGTGVRARKQYLLVPTARCDGCGGALGGHFEQGRDWYKCRVRGCTTIRADWLDGYAEDRLVSWLVLPEIRTRIWGHHDTGGGETVKAARGQLEKATGELEELYAAAEKGEAGSPVLVARTEKGIRGPHHRRRDGHPRRGENLTASWPCPGPTRRTNGSRSRRIT